jgi:hypothetical protein
MQDETPERLVAIRDQLERVKTKDFWEIIDRGRNFEYMPDPQRAQMPKFFEWLDLAVRERVATTPVSGPVGVAK